MRTDTQKKGGRIVILCEGDTEELAVRYFIARQWQTEDHQAVGLKAVGLRGRIQDVAVKSRLFFDEQNVFGVFTLVDLYGMDRVNHSPDDSLDTKVQRVRDWLREQVSHTRSNDFYPHVSVHETEALLLAEGSALAGRLNDNSIRPDPDAESKNFPKPPSRRINELFLTRKHGDRYQKIRDGTPLFKALNFDTVYNSCRYFRAFYDDLKDVGRRSE